MTPEDVFGAWGFPVEAADDTFTASSQETGPSMIGMSAAAIGGAFLLEPRATDQQG